MPPASNLLRRLLTLACLLTGLLVSGPVVAQSPAAQQGESKQASQPAHAKSTLEMGNGDFFAKQFEHSVPYPIMGYEKGPDGKPKVGLLTVYNESPAAQQGESKQASQPAHAKSTLEMGNGDFFAKQFEHSVPYPIMGYEKGPDGKPKVGLLTVYNVQPWQWISLGLILVLFLPVVRSFGGGRVSWFHRILRGWCLWIRDEMVYKVMGKEEGRPFVPFFLFLFFFIAVQNVVGLVPSIGHSLSIYTATGTPFVTVALALVTFLMMVGFGMKKNGVIGFWKGLVPHVPVLLWPMMFAIELVGLVVKPFALTIRLFANMLAGHLVIGSAIALIFLFAKMQGGAITSYLTALPCAGLAVFIYVIEAFVTLLQAYIFTFLSINFLHQAMHQEH